MSQRASIPNGSQIMEEATTVNADTDPESTETRSIGIAAERRTDLLAYIRRSGTVSGSELAHAFSVSAMTVHRDLLALANEGHIERIRGGARSKEEVPSRQTDWSIREARARQAKREIAHLARSHISDGDTIFLDASTTCLAIARELERDPPQAVTLVTNSPAIVGDLQLLVHVVVTPGQVDQDARTITGRWTEEFLQGVGISVAFLGGSAIELEHGLSTMQRLTCDVNRAARGASSKVIGVMDSSKFGQRALLSSVKIEELDVLITDSSLPPDVAARYRAAGVVLEN